MREIKQELVWYLKLAGNFDDYKDRCIKENLRCPLILLEYFYREIVSDVILGMMGDYKTAMLYYTLYCVLAGVMLFAVNKFYKNRAQRKRHDPMDMEALKNKFAMLKYDIDMGYYYYLQNVCARISNAANEFTYMRRAVVKFLNLDPSDEAFVSLDFYDDVITRDNLPLYNRDQDADEDGNPVKLKHKLSFSEISETTSMHLRRINDTFSCMNYILREESRRAGICSRIRKMFSRTQPEKIGLEMILDMRLYTIRTIGLVTDKHAGLMNSTPENITYNIAIMESAERNLSDKLAVVLQTLTDWLDLLYVRFVDKPHYTNIEYSKIVMPAAKRLAMKLSAEKLAMRVLQDMLVELEQEDDYEVSELAERAIEASYDNALRTIYAEEKPSMKLSDSSDLENRLRSEYLHKLVCIRNAVRIAKDDSDSEEDSDDEYIMTMGQNFREIEKRCRKLLEEGERKTLELHSVLRNVHYLVGHFADSKTDYQLRDYDVIIIRNALNTKFDEMLTAEELAEMLREDESNMAAWPGEMGDFPDGDQLRPSNL